jgi:hypothetical protein
VRGSGTCKPCNEERRTRPRYPRRWLSNEIFDGATPFYTYVRGVIIDGDGGVLLTGRDDSALIIEG